MFSEPLVIALFAAFFVLILVGIFWHRQLERLLRERHPEELDKLEAKDEEKEAEAGTSLQRFIWRGRYRRLRDPDVSRVAGRLFGLQVALGAVFASRTKPDARHATLDLLRAVRIDTSLPICAIGGITPANGAPLVDAGADLIAAVDGVFGAADIEVAARAYAGLFGR
jgi:pyridoxal biosynthesis lyase PdxS